MTTEGFFTWLFGSEEERAFSDAKDRAILRIVKEEIDPDAFDSESQIRKKISKSYEMEKWARNLENRSEMKSYLGWVEFFRNDCERRLKDIELWRDVDRAMQLVSKPPKKSD